jgi:hypothetical protein
LPPVLPIHLKVCFFRCWFLVHYLMY